MSVGDMETPLLAVASSDTSNSPLSTSETSWASILFLLEEREEEDPVILATVTRDDGLGDSFSLREAHIEGIANYLYFPELKIKQLLIIEP